MIIVADEPASGAQCDEGWKRAAGEGIIHQGCQRPGISGLLPLAVLILLMGKPSKQGCELVFMLALTDWESSLFYQI